jgi:hypothetical protein
MRFFKSLSGTSLYKKRKFRVIAFMYVRNEILYIEHSIHHLLKNGLEICVIDNGSLDGTRELLNHYFSNGIIKVIDLPFSGIFDKTEIFHKIEEMAKEMDADWFLLSNPDEIPLSPFPLKTLKEAIQFVDKKGYNTINFDEFVFIPEDGLVSYENREYEKEMRYYYFFEPQKQRLLRVWKKSNGVNLVESAGHFTFVPEQKVFPKNFILKHYIILSKRHALRKYGSRIFAKSDLGKGWSWNRAVFTPDLLSFPPKEELKELISDNVFDRTSPQMHHLFLNPEKSTADYKKQYLVPRNEFNKRADKPFADVSGHPLFPFLIGFRGSGVNILSSILNNYPELIILEKEGLIPYFIHNKHLPLESFIDELKMMNIFEYFGIDKNRFTDNLMMLDDFSIRNGIRLLYESYARVNHKLRYGDGSQGNNLWIAGIQNVFEEACFIHLIRDGREILQEAMKNKAFDITGIENFAAEWMTNLNETRQQSQFCGKYIEIRFEELIKDPEKILVRILGFLQFDSSGFPSGKNISAIVDKFRMKADYDLKPLTREEHRAFNSLAGETLKSLGYDISYE